MKAKQVGALLLLFGTSAFGQANQPLAIAAQPVERGANYCLWQGQISVTNQDGAIDTLANTSLYPCNQQQPDFVPLYRS